MTMKKSSCILLIVICFILSSCKTYEESTLIDRWYNKWNDKYYVYEIKRYNKKNDSLISARIDTVIIENKPLNGSFIYDY